MANERRSHSNSQYYRQAGGEGDGPSDGPSIAQFSAGKTKRAQRNLVNEVPTCAPTGHAIYTSIVSTERHCVSTTGQGNSTPASQHVAYNRKGPQYAHCPTRDVSTRSAGARTVQQYSVRTTRYSSTAIEAAGARRSAGANER